MNKLSFKTTTLIAAIGMSIVALFFGAEFATIYWFGMADVIFLSMPERITRHVALLIQLLSAAIFFFGVYRYPNQLPIRNRWTITVLITTLFLLCGVSLYVLVGVCTPFFSHPILSCNFYKLIVSVFVVGALWFCYTKAEDSSVGTPIRYISLAVCSVFLLSFLCYVGLCIGWSTCLFWFRQEMNGFIECIYLLAFIGVIVWLIVMLAHRDSKENN